jgi:two-component system response regulator GlrR
MACTSGPTRIVLVDDEGSFRESLAEMLQDDGHEVLSYPAPAAIPPLDSLADVDLLLTDYDMPGKNGLALADEFHAHHPATPVLIVTAYRSGLDAEVAHRPFLRLVQKPIGYDALHGAIHECAARPRASTFSTVGGPSASNGRRARTRP